jgi:hypothetical protein
VPTAISITGLILVAIAIRVPAEPFAQVGDRSNITGRIVNRLGCPLIAVLKLRPASAPFVDGALQEARSDADGRFVFQNVAQGRYWIHYDLDANGGWGGDGVVVGPAGAHKEFNWPTPSLTDVDDIDFLVTDRDGIPLAGAKVSWRRFSGAVNGPACGSEVTTDVDGRARVSQVPSGTYRITVEGDGRPPQTRDVRFGSGYEKSAIFRLLTPPEVQTEARTLHRSCGSTSHDNPPGSLQDLLARADAVVVGRIATAVLDPDYGSDSYPSVLTRYDLQLSEVVKRHPLLPATGAMARLAHLAGELEWGDKNVSACERFVMRSGESYLLFLTWNEQRRAFMPLSGNAFIANITSGELAPIRVSYTASPIIQERKGRSASQFLNEIKTALKSSR